MRSCLTLIQAIEHGEMFISIPHTSWELAFSWTLLGSRDTPNKISMVYPMGS